VTHKHPHLTLESFHARATARSRLRDRRERVHRIRSRVLALTALAFVLAWLAIGIQMALGADPALVAGARLRAERVAEVAAIRHAAEAKQELAKAQATARRERVRERALARQARAAHTAAARAAAARRAATAQAAAQAAAQRAAAAAATPPPAASTPAASSSAPTPVVTRVS